MTAKQLLLSLLRQYPNHVAALPAWGGARRKSRSIPAQIRADVPDEWAKNYRGRRADRDLYLVVRIPRSVYVAIRGARDRHLMFAPDEEAS